MVKLLYWHGVRGQSERKKPLLQIQQIIQYYPSWRRRCVRERRSSQNRWPHDEGTTSHNNRLESYGSSEAYLKLSYKVPWKQRRKCFEVLTFTEYLARDQSDLNAWPNYMSSVRINGSKFQQTIVRSFWKDSKKAYPESHSLEGDY